MSQGWSEAFPTAAVVGLLPGVGSFAWVAWRWWFDRADKRRGESLSREERLQNELEAQRATLSKEQGELFERVRAELQRSEAGRLATQQEAEKWAWLARWWYGYAHDLFLCYRNVIHEFRNVQQWMLLLRERDPKADLPEVTELPARVPPPLGLEDPLQGKERP